MSLLPKSIHRCRRYPTKFNSGWDIPLAGVGLSVEMASHDIMLLMNRAQDIGDRNS